MTLRNNWPLKLLNWYLEHKRDLPWRETNNPYYIFLSEMMLQQTQVDTVISYYKRFIQAFPKLEDLAAAPIDNVLKLWEGLGYYSRAHNLQKAAKLLVANHHSQFPKEAKELQKLPGIGPYCSAAIASIAFNQAIPVVDGNVLRVFSRFWNLSDDIGLLKTKQDMQRNLQEAIELSLNPGDFNQAMMELGATVCKPKQPNCINCPLASNCLALKNDSIHIRPVKAKKAKIPTYIVVVGIIWKNNKFLITKRKTKQLLGGLWEFPGGKVNSNESLDTAVKREILEEVGLSIKVNEQLHTINHAYSHFKIKLTAFSCDWLSGDVVCRDVADFAWIEKKDLNAFAFPKANIKLFDLIKS